MSTSVAKHLFASDSLQDCLVRAIAQHRLLPVKEVMESFEMFARVRKHVRGQVVADLCCGHGLVGILFALFERKVEKVLLVDRTQPDSRQRLLAVTAEIAPWVTAKIENHQVRLRVNEPEHLGMPADLIAPETAIVSAHACGVLSDACIAAAINAGGPLAVLPCCYPKSSCGAPQALQTALGLKTAYDVDRTYRLHRAGYHVRWDSIPAVITPMNRILCARMK